MLVKSILNHVQKQPGFVYTTIHQREGRLEVKLRARRRSDPRCSQCLQKRKAYDRLPARKFAFVPLWNIPVDFVYGPRRCECGPCGGVFVEALPWADGKSPHTHAYLWFLASWAKSLSWSETARRFGTTWHVVFTAVAAAVAWGRAHANYDNVTAIGVDEFSWKKRHQFLTLVYQIDNGCTRLIWVGQKRTKETFASFFTWLGGRAKGLRFVTSDMWQPFLQVAKVHVPHATHVLDRFHVMALFSKAIDEVRREDVAMLRKRGDTVTLTKTRWIFLKAKRKLARDQLRRLERLVGANLRVIKTYLLKEDFQRFWHYKSPHWAGVFLDNWLRLAGRKRIRPLRRLVGTLTAHKPLLLNWFRARHAFRQGATEGLNGKARVTTKRAYGFRSVKHAEIALFHTLGGLPEPGWHTHRFA
jgi:transposase